MKSGDIKQQVLFELNLIQPTKPHSTILPSTSDMASTTALPKLYFGTTTFGSSHVPTLSDPEFASHFLDVVHDLGITELDTAARYPPDNHGGSERMLGAVKANDKGFTLNTKVLFPGNNSDGTLSEEAVRKSMASSLKNLGVDKVCILYAHVPDTVTPLEEQARAFDEQYRKGFCEKVCDNHIMNC